MLFHPKALAFGTLVTLQRELERKERRALSNKSKASEEEIDGQRNICDSGDREETDKRENCFSLLDELGRFTFRKLGGSPYKDTEIEEINERSLLNESFRKSGFLNPPMTSRVPEYCMTEPNETKKNSNSPGKNTTEDEYEEILEKLELVKSQLMHSFKYFSHSFPMSSFEIRINQELEKFCAMWKNEKVKNALLKKENKSLKQAVQSLSQTNATLQWAYSSLEKKSTRNTKLVSFLQEAFLEHMDFLRTRTKLKRNKSAPLTFFDFEKTQLKKLGLNGKNKKKEERTSLKSSEKPKEPLGKEKAGNPAALSGGFPFENTRLALSGVFERSFSIQEAKEFLRQLAQEALLERKQKASFVYHSIKKIQVQDFNAVPINHLKIQRSISNPLLYRSANESLEGLPVKEKKQFQKKCLRELEKIIESRNGLKNSKGKRENTKIFSQIGAHFGKRNAVNPI